MGGSQSSPLSAGQSLDSQSHSMPLSLSSSSSRGQQKYSTTSTLSSSSPKSPKDLSGKRKSLITETSSCAGPGNSKTTVGNSKDASHPSEPSMDSQPMTRGLPTRSSILRGSFRRVKALTNVPPPVIPDEKFNRLSNVSLSSSSGFGSSSSSSQESTASSSSDSTSSSTLSSFAPAAATASSTGAAGTPRGSTVQFQLENGVGDSGAAARKARMNLRLNIIPSNPSVFPSAAAAVNGAYDNPYGTSRFNQPHSPIASPLASPLFYSGNDALRSPQSSSDWSSSAGPAAVTAGTGLRRSETISNRNLHSSSSTFRPDLNGMGQCDSLKSPTRSDYVELMCSTGGGGGGESRHSRSSFSSFDGSNYSSSSFNNSPNATGQTLDVMAMFQAGMNDNEVLSAWLGSIGFTEYFVNFIQAGYDMPSAARMTTEDLTAIGITKPLHRKRIRAEIARLPSVDLNFGCDLPDTTAQFLQAIGLTEYLSMFLNQNYTTSNDVMNLVFEDLEDIGVKKLGHLKKLSLAIKYFRTLRRNTAQSTVMEEETRRFSMGSLMSQDSNLGGSSLADDDRSSAASKGSLSSPHKRLLDKKTIQQQQQPILTTFQALSASPVQKDSPSAEAAPWRPRSALGRHPSPMTRTPDSEEIVLSWNGSNHKISSPAALSDSNGSLAEKHCTLPRRKSIKSGAGKSIAKIMAQVFRSEKGPSAPTSPNKDQSDSPLAHSSYGEARHISHMPNGRSTAPLASFSKLSSSGASHPPPSSPSNLSKNRNPTSPDSSSFNEMGSLSRFPPPPSPLLRDYQRDEPVDVDKTPVLSHRSFACNNPATVQQQQAHPVDFSLRDFGQQRQQSSMPFAQDNIGTIKQRTGRQVPSMSSLIFCDPNLSRTAAAAASKSNGRADDDSTNEEVLDEISAMLGSLSDELDVAMEQLENAAH